MASDSGDRNNEGGLFDVVRRKWGKVQDVLQGLASPLKRHSMYDELPEHVWPQEPAGVSQVIQHGLGHSFLPCQLSNPTWCDYCGDFIWGIYKQCQRCHRMDDSGYYTRGVGDFQVCSPPTSARSIFSLKFSELPASEYNGFLHGFKDEQDFEEFKQDLRDFQKLKREFCCRFVDGSHDDDDDSDELIDFTELQFICQPNYVCRSRRGYMSRSSKEGSRAAAVMPVRLRLSSTPAVPAGLITADTSSHMEHTTALKDSSQQTFNSALTAGRPGSSDVTVDVDWRASLVGSDRNAELELSIRDILMEFLNEDQHFQEFEQVFETVRNRRISKDLDTCRELAHIDTGCRISPHIDTDCSISPHTDVGCKISSHVDTGSYPQLDTETGDNSLADYRQPSLVSDIFADFFDNDDTFVEFEKEFDKFRFGRRSHLLESLHDLSSTNGVFNDLNIDCDKHVGSYSRSHMDNNPCYSQNDNDAHRPVLCSAKDWTKMVRKIRRNSCISMDTRTDKRPFRHRYSIEGISENLNQTEEQHKACSLSDLRQCYKHEPPPSSSRGLTSEHESPLWQQVDGSVQHQPSSQNSQKMLTSEPNFAFQGPSFTRTRGRSTFIDSVDNGNESCNGEWSAIIENSSRSSSPGHCCSSSCFCQSDLFIEEACDTPQVDSDRPQVDSDRPQVDSDTPQVDSDRPQIDSDRPQVDSDRPQVDSDTPQVDSDTPQVDSDRPNSAPARSLSLMELRSQSSITDVRLHTNSLEHFNLFKECHINGTPLSDSLLPRVSHSNTSISHVGDGDLDDSLSISPPSASCSHLSDADSEHYHTAESDLSGLYSTAKSNLSLLIEKLQCAVIGQRASFEHSEEPAPNSDSDLSDYTFDRTKSQQHRSVIRDHYHTYNGRDDRVQVKDRRPRSGSACQYTCHEHCVPAVTLSCKSVSGDGYDIVAARTPSPPDPRSHGEACLFISSMQARPGGARIVSNSTADTPVSRAARTSESVPSFQHLAQGRGVAGYMDTPRPSNIHHRSWSISEDIVTPHSYPIQHLGVTSDPARHSSQAPHTSSPPCQSSCSDSHFDSFPHGNIQSELHSSTHRVQSNCVGEGILAQHVKGGYRPAGCESSALDLPDVYRRDEDTSPEAATEKDETDSGYRSGTIPDDKLPRVPSQATLDQQELKRKVAKYNHFVPAVCLEVTEKESFQGFMKVTMNLIRPITMELGARPPSIYELLTREHIVEENTQQVAFYMPRDTHKSLHITSDTTTKEVIASLLKKFHILDHPRKFAMYEQEFNDRNKLVRLRRLTDKDCPLRAMVNWDPERIKNYRMVLQENETGEIVWDAFSLPELNNFLRVLDREEKETVRDLKHKYAYMKQYIDRRLTELRGECTKKTKNKT